MKNILSLLVTIMSFTIASVCAGQIPDRGKSSIGVIPEPSTEIQVSGSMKYILMPPVLKIWHSWSIYGSTGVEE